MWASRILLPYPTTAERRRRVRAETVIRSPTNRGTWVDRYLVPGPSDSLLQRKWSPKDQDANLFVLPLCATPFAGSKCLFCWKEGDSTCLLPRNKDVYLFFCTVRGLLGLSTCLDQSSELVVGRNFSRPLATRFRQFSHGCWRFQAMLGNGVAAFWKTMRFAQWGSQHDTSCQLLFGLQCPLAFGDVA